MGGVYCILASLCQGGKGSTMQKVRYYARMVIHVWGDLLSYRWWLTLLLLWAVVSLAAAAVVLVSVGVL